MMWTFYDVQKELAGSIRHHMLQERAKNNTRAKPDHVQSSLLSIFHGHLFSLDLGKNIPDLPIKKFGH
jgi:hypothetical protein